MAWYQKLFGKGNNHLVRKDAVSGGLSLLEKLVGPEFTQKNFIEQYGKSLYVFACINKIATKVAGIDFSMHRILNSKGDTREVQVHPLLDLLYKPNKFQTKGELWETLVINLKTTGDAFIFKVRNERGQVVELWNLRPDMMTIIPDPTNFIKQYEFTKSDGSKSIFAPEDIIHFKYTDPISAYTGISPLRPAQVRVQTEEYATKFQRDFFLNSARPDAIIKNPKASLTRDQKEDIKEGWDKKFRGVGKTSSVAILEGGLEYQLVSLTQKDMDYIEGLKFTRDDILVAFQVPKPIVAVLDDVNRANSETAMYIFLSENIKPEMQRIVDKINEELVSQDFGEDFYLDFKDPTPQNREMLLKEYESGLVNGYLLINEVRSREGLEPIKGGWTLYKPFSDNPVGGLTGKTLFKAGGDTKAKAYEGGVKDETKRYDFKGRYWLKQKFSIRETVVEAGLKAIATVGKKKIKTGKKKTFTPLIKDASIKSAYAGMIIKKIDAEAEKFKTEINNFFQKQGEGVIEKLNTLAKDIKKKSLDISSVFNKDEQVKVSAEFILPWLTNMYVQAGKESLLLIEPQTDFQTTKRIQATIKRRAQDFAESVNTTTSEKLQATLAEGIAASEGIVELRNRVEDVYKAFPAYRSEMIARTEATAANNEGILEGFKQSDVATGKEWVATQDERTRDSHLAQNGEIVAVDKVFSNGLSFPGDGKGDPAETINCRCVLAPAFVE